MTQQTSVEGRPADGIEYIGHDAATGLLRSMLFSSEGPGRFCPFALECFWSIEGDDLTIWHGSKDSPARFLGTIDRSAGVVRGASEWPGGGYTATARRTLSPQGLPRICRSAGERSWSHGSGTVKSAAPRRFPPP